VLVPCRLACMPSADSPPYGHVWLSKYGLLLVHGTGMGLGTMCVFSRLKEALPLEQEPEGMPAERMTELGTQWSGAQSHGVATQRHTPAASQAWPAAPLTKQSLQRVLLCAFHI